MFSFFPPLLVIIGLVGLILLFINQQPAKESKSLQKLFSPFREKKQQQFQKWFLALAERLLVHLRVIILKLDRFLSNNLSYLRKKRTSREDKKEKVFSSLASLNRKRKTLSSQGADSQGATFLEEEKKLLRQLEKFPDNKETLMNLARIYLWKGDFSSARGILLQAYRRDKEDRITQALLIELKEREEGQEIKGNRPR